MYTNKLLFVYFIGRQVTSSYNITRLLPQYYLLILSWEIQCDKKKVVLLLQLMFFCFKKCMFIFSEWKLIWRFFFRKTFFERVLHHTAHTTHTSHSTHAAHSTSRHSRSVFFDFSYNGLCGCQKWGHTTSIS